MRCHRVRSVLVAFALATVVCGADAFAGRRATATSAAFEPLVRTYLDPAQVHLGTETGRDAHRRSLALARAIRLARRPSATLGSDVRRAVRIVGLLEDELGPALDRVPPGAPATLRRGLAELASRLAATARAQVQALDVRAVRIESADARRRVRHTVACAAAALDAAALAVDATNARLALEGVVASGRVSARAERRLDAASR